MQVPWHEGRDLEIQMKRSDLGLGNQEKFYDKIDV